MDLTDLMTRMEDLIEHNAGGDIHNFRNLMTAAIIAGEDAVRAGVVSGKLWDECGAHLLAAHFAYFKGVSIGTFTAPAFGEQHSDMHSPAGAPHVSGPAGCGVDGCCMQPEGHPHGCEFHHEG
ncbi:MAG: hypothetical protein M3164_05695 [Actinomycetota bacterium]|nr:hypothetical protein [Actinomycetota bacterium]